jgi:hypothetical protein
VIAAFEDAQTRAFALLADVVRSLRSGAAEDACVRFAIRSAASHGFLGFFRPPVVRFDPTAQRFSLPTRRILRSGMLVEIVLLPVTSDAVGHVAVTLPFEGEGDPLCDGARETCRAVLGFANRTKTSGELHVFAKAWANNHRARLPGRSIGFHCPQPEGAFAVAWPRGAWALTRLRRHQLEHLNPRPLRGVYAVRPRIAMGARAASFGELLFVDGDEKTIVGRNSLDDVGALHR